MNRCEWQAELDGLVVGELPESRAAALAAHAPVCAACGPELSWLRAERCALKSRPAAAAGVIVPLRDSRRGAGFAAVRARAAALQREGRSSARRSLAVAALGAAAAILVAVQGEGRPAHPLSDADAAELSSVIPWCGERPDAVGALELQFAACLTSTPRALPGSPAVCL